MSKVNFWYLPQQQHYLFKSPLLSSYTNKHTYSNLFCQVPNYLPHTKPPTRTLFYQHPGPSGETDLYHPHPPIPSYFIFFSPQEFRLLQGGEKKRRKRKKKKEKKIQNASSSYHKHHKHYKHHSSIPRSQKPSPHCRNMRLYADQPIRTITTPPHGSRRMHTRPYILIVGYHD